MEPWLITRAPQADEEIERLKNRRRKIWIEANKLISQLRVDPYSLGEECEAPWQMVRNVHFWNDKYRLVWTVDDEFHRVLLLACGLKTPTFYNRVFEQVAGLSDRLTDS